MLWILRVPKLRSILRKSNSLQVRDGIVRKTRDTNDPPSAKYDILISIFHPRPDQQKVFWDVRSAIDSKYQSTKKNRKNLIKPFVLMFNLFFPAYIQPFVKEIQPVSNFVVKSQWKYQVPFESSKKQVKFA